MAARQGDAQIAVLVGLDRKTVQRYIAAAAEVGLGRGLLRTAWTTPSWPRFVSEPGPAVAMGTADRGQSSRPTMTN